MGKLPPAYKHFQEAFRRVWKAYDHMGAVVHQEGPLRPKFRELIKLGIAIGGRLEGAVKAYTRLAIEQGASAEDSIRWHSWPSPRPVSPRRWVP